MKKKYKVRKTNLTTRMIKSREQLDGVLPPTIYHCENCGVPLATWHLQDFNFCMNCGAKIVSKKGKKQ